MVCNFFTYALLTELNNDEECKLKLDALCNIMNTFENSELFKSSSEIDAIDENIRRLSNQYGSGMDTKTISELEKQVGKFAFQCVKNGYLMYVFKLFIINIS